jgi:signal transduction histidine kinase
VRRQIILFELIILVFITVMIGVMVVTFRLTDDFVSRIDGVHERFEVIAELDGHANNFAEQIAEVLLLGSEQMSEFEGAREEMEQGFADLVSATRAEAAILDDIGEVRDQVVAVEQVAALRELYNAINGAADRVFRLREAGRLDEAIELFRRDVEYRLASDFETMIETALQGEREEVAREREDVRAARGRLIAIAGGLALAVVLAGGVLGFALYRSIVHPVQALAGGAAALAKEQLDHRIPVVGAREFAALSRSFNDMAKALEDQRVRLRASNDRLEQEVDQRTRELQSANRRLSELDLRRAQFLADVSHELRTPLTIIRGEADFARRGKASGDECLETLGRIGLQAADMTRQLEALLAFARWDIDETAREGEVVDVEALLEAAAHEGNVLAEPHEIAVNLVRPAPRASVRGSTAQLKQALIIGIDNAVKYSDAEGVVLLSAVEDCDAVFIDILDEGIGVDAEEREQVFDRFYRGQISKERAIHGLGIGLSIAKSIVERHGGSISLAARTPRGSVLSIRLPIWKERADANPPG